MTYREFYLAMMRHPVLGKLLPLECRRTYPVLSRERESLCAAFIGFPMRPAAGGAEAQAPVYYLKVTYPQCAVRVYVRFHRPQPDWRPMTPQSPETIRQLAVLCDQALAAWDDKTETVDEVLRDYNGLLRQVLEPEQRAALDSLAHLDCPQ